MNKNLRNKCKEFAKVEANKIFNDFINNAENHKWLTKDTEKVGKVEVPIKPRMIKDKIADGIMLVTAPIQKALDEAISIINDLVDDDPCWYDHHGHCQAHGWPYSNPPCPHARAKEFIKKYS